MLFLEVVTVGLGRCHAPLHFRSRIHPVRPNEQGLRGCSGKPLHPPLTDVPIAAYLFTAAFDVLSVVLHGPHPAVARQLSSPLPGRDRDDCGDRTRAAGNRIAPTCVARSRVDPVLAVVLSVTAAVLVSAGASLGGSLVFDYGFDVETAGAHPVWHKSEIDVRPGQSHG